MKYNLSLLEFLILKQLYVDGFNYLVRDIDNNLCAYKDYPKFWNDTWIPISDWYDLEAFNNIFDFVGYEEPIAVKDVLSDYNCDEAD